MFSAKASTLGFAFQLLEALRLACWAVELPRTHCGRFSYVPRDTWLEHTDRIYGEPEEVVDEGN